MSKSFPPPLLRERGSEAPCLSHPIGRSVLPPVSVLFGVGGDLCRVGNHIFFGAIRRRARAEARVAGLYHELLSDRLLFVDVL